MNTQRKLTSSHSGAALRWLDSLSSENQWDLTTQEQTILLGGIPSEQFQVWMTEAKQGRPVEVPPEVVERLGLLLSIYRSLTLLMPDDPKREIANWFNRAIEDPDFHGKSTRAVLLDDPSLPNLAVVAHRLRSLCITSS